MLTFQTFRPRKKFEHGTMKYNLHKQANASLNAGIDLKEVVRLPQGEDMNDWIAVHGKGLNSWYDTSNRREEHAIFI